MAQLTPAAQELMDRFREIYCEPPPESRKETHQSISLDVAGFMDDLRLNWKDLPENCREEIRRKIPVVVSDSNNFS